MTITHKGDAGRARHALLALFAAATLAACGGGGGGSSPPASPPAAPVAPQISSAPASVATSPGQTVTFRAAAIGSAPLAYEWLRNGTVIGGATASSYSFTSATGDDGARFAVRVTNAVGTVTSAEAQLTIHAAPAAATSCTGGAAFTAHADNTLAAGGAAGVALAGCTSALQDVRWSQQSGPALSLSENLLAAKTQAATFEPATPGTYVLRADFRDGGGVARSADVTVTVAAASTASRVLIRGDQAVRKGGNVSLRAWPQLATGDTIVGYRWEQLSGPPVVMEVAGIDTAAGRAARALLRAPEVAQDTLLRFRVTLTTTAGTTTDDAFVLVENAAQAPANSNYVFDGIHVSRVYPYRAAGPFAGSLVRCTYDASLQWSGGGKNLCSLQTLPFLHQTTGGGVPTTEQIMQRVLVSHDWMGANFEAFLNSPLASSDLKRMFNGVTAIVIGAHVRPSYYYALSGAIYLDGDGFFLTALQLDNINEQPDFRTGLDRELGYSGLWRYVLNNGNIFQLCSISGRGGRPQDCLLYDSGWLLYHELGHAADFMPPAEQPTANLFVSAWDNISPRFNGRQLPSDLLDGTHPLSSAQMKALAQVKFFTGPPADPSSSVGGIPYATLRGYTPQQVADFFRVDGAGDEYNYATTREDITMLVEEFFMQKNHGIRRDVAITDKITPATTGNTLIVRWGQRGRVGEPAVRTRVDFSVRRLAPWVLAADPNAVTNLPPPIPMRAGESWNANVVLPGPLSGAERAQALSAPFDRATDRALLERAQSGWQSGRALHGMTIDQRLRPAPQAVR